MRAGLMVLLVVAFGVGGCDGENDASAKCNRWSRRAASAQWSVGRGTTRPTA